MGQCINSRRYVVLDAQADLLVQQELDAGKSAHQQVVTLVLLGTGRSGKSTIFKQCRRVYAQDEFSQFEKEKYRMNIFDQIICQLQLLVDGCQSLHSQFPQAYPELQVSPENLDLTNDLLSLTHINGMNMPPHTHELVTRLWGDPAVRHGFSEFRDQFDVYDSSSYFWDNIDRISQPDYTPSDKDCICVRDSGNRVSDVLFETPQGQTLRVVDLGQRTKSGKKYIHFFSEADTILFVVSLSSYDERVYIDAESKNGLHEALDFFEESLNTEHISDKNFVLVLNKLDVFSQKLKTTNLSECFDDFKDAALPNEDIDDEETCRRQYQQREEDALEYIQHQFLAKNRSSSREISIHVVTATDPTSVRELFLGIQR